MLKPTRSSSSTNFKPLPTPKKGGLKKARVSLIVDLGVQTVPPSEYVQKETKSNQVAVYVDLVNEIVDYGGEIGERQYRFCLNGNDKGKIRGINFKIGPKRDLKGNIVEKAPYQIHEKSKLCELARAVEKEEFIYETDHKDSLNLGCLLDQPLMVDIKIVEGKPREDGEIPKYVNYTALVQVQEDDDGNKVPVKKLQTEAKLVTFENATKDDIKILRRDVILLIKEALNYDGSKIKRAIEEFEEEIGQEIVPYARNQKDKKEQKESKSKHSEDDANEDNEDTGGNNSSKWDDDIPF